MEEERRKVKETQVKASRVRRASARRERWREQKWGTCENFIGAIKEGDAFSQNAVNFPEKMDEEESGEKIFSGRVEGGGLAVGEVESGEEMRSEQS